MGDPRLVSGPPPELAGPDSEVPGGVCVWEEGVNEGKKTTY